MSHQRYWKEAASLAIEGTCGIRLTDGQLEDIGEALAISAENEGMAHGYDDIPNPMEAEVERVQRLRVNDQERHDAVMRAKEKEIADLRQELRSVWRELEKLKGPSW